MLVVPERKRLRARRKFSIYELIDALATALDVINPAVDAHHKLVCYIAATVAEELGLPRQDYNDLFVAAYLHDIGSLPLAERMRILEFDMKSPHLHAELGYNLLTKFPHISDAPALVRFHHVPWNYGGGYPLHLADEEISLGSRILAVSDIFTALSEDRPYRKGFGKEKTRENFEKRVSGGKISREIVQLLFDHYDAIDQVRRQAQDEERVKLADFWEAARNGYLSNLEDAAEDRAEMAR